MLKVREEIDLYDERLVDFLKTRAEEQRRVNRRTRSNNLAELEDKLGSTQVIFIRGADFIAERDDESLEREFETILGYRKSRLRQKNR